MVTVHGRLFRIWPEPRIRQSTGSDHMGAVYTDPG